MKNEATDTEVEEIDTEKIKKKKKVFFFFLFLRCEVLSQRSTL